MKETDDTFYIHAERESGGGECWFYAVEGHGLARELVGRLTSYYSANPDTRWGKVQFECLPAAAARRLDQQRRELEGVDDGDDFVEPISRSCLGMMKLARARQLGDGTITGMVNTADEIITNPSQSKVDDQQRKRQTASTIAAAARSAWRWTGTRYPYLDKLLPEFGEQAIEDLIDRGCAAFEVVYEIRSWDGVDSSYCTPIKIKRLGNVREWTERLEHRETGAFIGIRCHSPEGEPVDLYEGEKLIFVASDGGNGYGSPVEDPEGMAALLAVRIERQINKVLCRLHEVNGLPDSSVAWVMAGHEAGEGLPKKTEPASDAPALHPKVCPDAGWPNIVEQTRAAPFISLCGWFGLGKDAMKSAIKNGTYKAKPLSERYWVAEMEDVRNAGKVKLSEVRPTTKAKQG